MSGAAILTLPTPADRAIDAQALIAQAIERGTDPAALERLVALGERMLVLQARQAWVAEMTAAQREFPPIEKSKDVSTSLYSYSYAPLDEIDAATKPVLHRHGLVETWQYDGSRPGEVGANCRITHGLGHFEDSGFFYVPIEPARTDGKGATPAQRAGIAATYARRYSSCAIKGIVPHGEDPDGKVPESDTPSPVSRADGSVLVVKIDETHGGKPGQRGWTLYRATFDDGRVAGVFDSKKELVAELHRAHAEQALVVALLEEDKAGRFNLVSLSPPETPGPVGDALDGFATDTQASSDPAPDVAMERKLLNSTITAYGDKLKLKSAERANAWKTYVGNYAPDGAPLEKLNDLVLFLKLRAGE